MTTNLHAPGEPDAPYRLLLDRLAADLIGPAPGSGPGTDIPSEAFMTGILFPKDTRHDPEEDREEAADVELAGKAKDEGEEERPPRIEKAIRPAAAGLSLAVLTDATAPAAVSLTITGARYRDEVVTDHEGKTKRYWHRHAVTAPLDCVYVDGSHRIDLAAELGDPDFEGLFLAVVSSPYPEGDAAGDEARLVTLVVYNEGKDDGKKPDRFEMNRQALFEFRMTVRAAECSRLIGRPLRGRNDGEGDDRAAALLWRDAQEYAVGHTCAAHWDAKANPVGEVSTAWLPATRVEDTSARGHDCFADVGPLLKAEALADPAGEAQSLALCDRLVTAYEGWIEETGSRVAREVPPDLHDQAHAHLATCAEAAQRMRGGVEALRDDPVLMRAFRLANLAMHRQQTWKRDENGKPLPVLVWRPFQLGFFLLSAASSILPTHEDRETMDLIWFPTGGGKTEAYLLLTAFAIFARRMKRGARGQGVCAIMRYTLRLLTLQQFERAAAMICAANLIWGEEGNDIAQEPVALGLWLGSATSPNRRKDAVKILEGGKVPDVGSPERLEKCPECHAEVDWHTTGEAVEVTCGTDGCTVGEAGALPLYTNDDDIYDHRPALVIGTADKFAQIARKWKTEALFGARHDVNDPPDLIVQDELHLISGPLGTQTGLYETAIDRLCTKDGCKPKVIGSTATIRRASEQVRALFARATMQFPPPGIDADDSAFAVRETRPDRRGRLYLGISTIGHSKPEMLQAVCASLLQSASVLTGKERDACWTLLGYFNSLKELGGSVTLLQVIAPETMKRFARAHGDKEVRAVDEQTEITSRIPSEDIGGVLDSLSIAHDEPGAIDVALATNMISVGVDVERLGLMVVDGQPKGISEYIQATSRVGRSGTDGLVVGLYTAYRPRDRSRFETHRTWHGALYRDVEATSVTPFAPRARDRALHAPFVALAAHRYPELWQSPGKAETLRPELEAIIDEIVGRVRGLDRNEADEADATRAQLLDFLDDWCGRDGLEAWWQDPATSLLMSVEDAAKRKAARRGERPAKATPNSMRGVEATVRIDLEDF